MKGVKMFSCIKYKAGRDKDEDSEGNPKPNKDSSKSITKQLKGLALKVTGGSSSSSRQSKVGRKGSSQAQEHGKLPGEQQGERETHVPSSAADMTGYDDENSYFYSPPPPPPGAGAGAGAEITRSNASSYYDDHLGFVAVPTPTPTPTPTPPHHTTRSANANANANANADADAEWVAHVEEGVTIVFLSLPNGANDLRRIRFSRDMYDRDLAQSWWISNYDRVRELYNVHSFNGQPALIPPNRSGPIISSAHHQEHHPHQLRFEQQDDHGGRAWNDEPSYEGLIGRHQYYQQQQYNYEEGGASSSAVGAAAAMGMGIGMATPAPATLTPSNSFRIDPEATHEEVEWVEQDEPGVFITIKKCADGTRQIRRLRFSRQHYETDDARNWWFENKERIEAQYL